MSLPTCRRPFGKILAIWGPTLLFFSQGFEHAVVNMFLIPVGMMLGGNISISTWWLWNQIPVTLGNLVGGMLFTGFRRLPAHRGTAPAMAHPVPTAVPLQPVNQRPDQPGYSPSY
ncbi:MAG: formate/nitrite transporter family protein [Nitrospira sp.]|nr:formate/nitrite transporter family protein [Nitrospira sp.]